MIPKLSLDECIKALQNIDQVSNARCDMEQLTSGKIKDQEHLEAVEALMDCLGNIETSAASKALKKENDIYKFINSKSIDELKSIFKRLQELNDELNEILQF